MKIENECNDVKSKRQIQLDRFNKLKAGPGNRKGMFSNRTCVSLITVEEVIKIKNCLTDGLTNVDTVAATGLSDYYVRNTKRGYYDHMLKQH